MLGEPLKPRCFEDTDLLRSLYNNIPPSPVDRAPPSHIAKIMIL